MSHEWKKRLKSFQYPALVLILGLLLMLIPSGSGKGALLSPILVPIAMELGLTSQSSVLAYQFGDGITNMLFPTAGVLMAVIAQENATYIPHRNPN